MLLASSTLVTGNEEPGGNAIDADMVLSNTLVSAGESLDAALDWHSGRRSAR
jgi:hypothetical protein